MKIQKISNCVFYVLCAIILLSFLAFFVIGFDNMEGDKNAPKLTGYLLFMMYALGVITAASVIWSLIANATKSSGSDEIKATGIRGTMISWGITALTIIAMVVGLVIGIGEPDFTSSSGVFTPGYMITVVDVFMWAIYILFLVSVVAVIVSATGIFNRK